MLQVTQEILNKAIKLAVLHKLTPERALSEAFSDELGFGSTDMFTAAVLKELHLLGLLLNHKIER